jgi:hypothetical protein
MNWLQHAARGVAACAHVSGNRWWDYQRTSLFKWALKRTLAFDQHLGVIIHRPNRNQTIHTNLRDMISRSGQRAPWLNAFTLIELW